MLSRVIRRRAFDANRFLARRISTKEQPSVASIAANDPKAASRTPIPNVSRTNELASSSMGSQDAAIQESVAEGEKLRAQQAPNRDQIWAPSQQPREAAMVGPRFEQMTMTDQVRRPQNIASSTLPFDQAAN